MVVLEAVAANDVYSVILAMLNVIQTVALAYLAAERRTVHQLRKNGVLTRRDDAAPPSA